MGVKAVDRAWESDAAGTDLLVLLALADHAGGEDDPYGHAYPSVDRLVGMTKTSRRTVQRSLRSLEEQGLIRATGQYAWGRGKVTTVYRIEEEGGVRMTPRQDDAGATGDQRGASPMAPKPSIEPSIGEDDRARTRPKINGKPVNDETWRRTLHALVAFNDQAGKRMLPTTGSGEPSEAAKRIYSRLASWPDLSDEQIADVIQRTLSSRWWGSDPPTVGVVFGPKVFEENLSRDGTPASSNGKLPAGVTPIRRRTEEDQRFIQHAMAEAERIHELEGG